MPVRSDLLGILGTINTFISVLYVLLNKTLGEFVSRAMFPTLLDKNLHFRDDIFEKRDDLSKDWLN